MDSRQTFSKEDTDFLETQYREGMKAASQSDSVVVATATQLGVPVASILHQELSQRRNS